MQTFHEKFVDDVAVEFSKQLHYVSGVTSSNTSAFEAAIRDCIIAFCNMVFKHDPQHDMESLYRRCGYEGTIPYYGTKRKIV